TLAAAERAALGALLGALLDEGSVLEAARVCRYFQLRHRDVALVLLCRALALGEAGLQQPEVRALLTEAGAAPGAASLEDWTPLGSGDDAVVAALKALAEGCVHGRGYCRQVLCLYELSKVSPGPWASPAGAGEGLSRCPQGAAEGGIPALCVGKPDGRC
ncbi:spatacsin-like, partial [Pyrgilauda ruficollis]|uniref:spatacsin-like n=1 Tax=Pyrgilauda ruficollis TaxID=221976 RepID=UPI001B87D20D